MGDRSQPNEVLLVLDGTTGKTEEGGRCLAYV